MKLLLITKKKILKMKSNHNKIFPLSSLNMFFYINIGISYYVNIISLYCLSIKCLYLGIYESININVVF